MSPLFPIILLTLAPPAPSAECGGQLNELLHSKQYRAAASRGERCWQETHEAAFLTLAIQARVRLRHGAHAANDLREYTAAPDAAQQNIHFYREDIRPLVVTVEVEVTNAAPETAQLRAVYMDEPRRGALFIDYASLPATATLGRELALDPGKWNIELVVGDDLVASQVIEAAPGLQVLLEAPPIPVLVSEPPPEPVPVDAPPTSVDRRRLGLPIGLGVTSASLATGGAILLAKPTSPWHTTEELSKIAIDRASEVWHGSVLVGAGIGGTAVVVSELTKAPRVAYYAELGIGGAIGLGGLIGTAVHVRSYKRETSTPGAVDLSPSYFHDHLTKEVATGLLLGIGTGLATGAAVSLVTRALSERRRGSRTQTARRRP